MELLYLWIDDYLNIIDCGFNLSSRISVSHKADRKAKTFSLTIKDNENFLPTFFGNNILDITGIIGANGVGKSNLLDYLKIFITTQGFEEEFWLAVMLDRKTGKLHIIHSLFEYDEDQKSRGIKYKNQWSISLDKQTTLYPVLDIAKANVGYTFVPEPYHNGKTIPEFNASLIIYSPFLDLREYPYLTKYNAESYIDISTNYLIDHDSDKQPHDRDKVEVYRYKNVERQFIFVQENFDFVKEINFPTELEIRFSKAQSNDEIRGDDQGYLAKEFYKKFRDSISSKWNQVPNHLIHEGKKTRSREKIKSGRKIKCKWWFVINLVTNFLYNISYKVDLHDNYFKVSRTLDEFDFKDDDPVDLAKKFFEKQSFVSTKQFDFIGFIDLITGVIDNNADVMSMEEDNESWFRVSPEIGKEIWEHHELYIQSFKDKSSIRGFLDVNWRDISSGEKSFLDLFSRLHWGIKQIPKGMYSKPCYILLDEAEAGFHPQWQRTYITFLLKYFKTHPELSFHIILATHSPFIASDLPMANLLLLDKGTAGNCSVQEGFDSISESFGANIHSLLADAFFMDNGLMGEFAKEKINALFKMTRTDLLEQKDYYKKILNLIGEPLVKMKLMELYAEKLGPEYEAERLQDEIDFLQQKLALIQNRANDPDQ